MLRIALDAREFPRRLDLSTCFHSSISSSGVQITGGVPAAHYFDSWSHHRVSDVTAVPRQQIPHSVHRCDRDMKRVDRSLRRNWSLGNQRASERSDIIRGIQHDDAVKDSKSLLSSCAPSAASVKTNSEMNKSKCVRRFSHHSIVVSRFASTRTS